MWFSNDIQCIHTTSLCCFGRGPSWVCMVVDLNPSLWKYFPFSCLYKHLVSSFFFLSFWGASTHCFIVYSCCHLLGLQAAPAYMGEACCCIPSLLSPEIDGSRVVGKRSYYWLSVALAVGSTSDWNSNVVLCFRTTSEIIDKLSILLACIVYFAVPWYNRLLKVHSVSTFSYKMAEE